jgi:hypothetical protein
MRIGLELRASKMPLAFKCPGSTVPPAMAISEEGADAALGTAVHEVLRTLAERDYVDWEAIPKVAESYGISADDVFALVRMAAKLWALSLRESFGGALTEVPLTAEIPPHGLLLTGHADLMVIREGVARAADWKTGRVDSDYSAQMRSYAALILLENADVAEATVTIVWIRDGEIENYTMTRAGLREWLAELTARVLEWDGVYHPGQHCRYCPRSHECGARDALVRRDIAALSGAELASQLDTTLALMKPDAIVELHRQASSVIDVGMRVRDAIKAHVIARGDVVGDGVRLTVETHERRELVPEKAWPVLEDFGFESADFAACIDLHVSKVEKIAAQRAGRGKGAAAVRALAERFATAEAVNVKETHSLRAKRA